jgi:predicted amidohydrolase
VLKKKIQKKMLAVIQLCCTENMSLNFQIAQKLIRKTKITLPNVKFICLPENIDYIGGTNNEPHMLNDHSKFLQQYKDLAIETKTWLSLGGIHELASSNTANKKMQYNTHIILDDLGIIRAKYRKIHLFDTSIDGGWKESESTLAGDEIVIVKDTPVGTVGLSTCFDLRFPNMYQIMKSHGDVDVILIPSAFMPTTGKAHWETLLRARAIETQTYVVASAQCGPHNPKRSSYGRSMICGPFGEVLVDLGTELQENIGGCIIDFNHIQSVRKAMPMNEKINDLNNFKLSKM